MELDYTYWKDDGWHVGYMDDYPDYTTQGETLEEFEDMLRSLHEDIRTFDFSFVQHHGKLKDAALFTHYSFPFTISPWASTMLGTI